MSEVPSQSGNDGAGRYKEQLTPERGRYPLII
jgi:hypothetical protein